MVATGLGLIVALVAIKDLSHHLHLLHSRAVNHALHTGETPLTSSQDFWRRVERLAFSQFFHGTAHRRCYLLMLLDAAYKGCVGRRTVGAGIAR